MSESNSVLGHYMTLRSDVDATIDEIDREMDSAKGLRRQLVAVANSAQAKHSKRLGAAVSKMSDDDLKAYMSKLSASGQTGLEGGEDSEYTKAHEALRHLDVGIADLADVRRAAVETRQPIPGSQEFTRRERAAVRGLNDAQFEELKRQAVLQR